MAAKKQNEVVKSEVETADATTEPKAVAHQRSWYERFRFACANNEEYLGKRLIIDSQKAYSELDDMPSSKIDEMVNELVEQAKTEKEAQKEIWQELGVTPMYAIARQKREEYEVEQIERHSRLLAQMAERKRNKIGLTQQPA